MVGIAVTIFRVIKVTVASIMINHVIVREYSSDPRGSELSEDVARLNFIYEFGLHRKENTTLHHYNDELVNGV
jgi:hypothetical protein